MAQDGTSWMVKIGNRKVFAATTEDEKKNVISLSAAALLKDSQFVLSYSDMNADTKTWDRSFILEDESGELLLQKEKTKILTLKTAELATLLETKKKIKVYTEAIPSDPKLAALVRVRRVHLCTLQLN